MGTLISMGPSRYRRRAAAACGALYLAYVVACGSFDADATVAPVEGGTDARDDAALSEPCARGSCRVVFVTSGSYRGDFGGVDGGDQKCEKLARESPFPGIRSRTFIAWLSETDAAAKDRHAAEGKPYVRVDGVKVAAGWNQLTSAVGDAAALEAPIQIDERGESVGLGEVWTGTTYNGSPSGNTCTGWTANTGAGQIGRADQVNEAWTDTDVPLNRSGDCASTAHLYCLER